MIQLSTLSKSFGDRVLLDAVSWQIDDRERVGLAGPNGAGKTTLLKMLAGLDEPDAGSVVKPSGLAVGYLPQDGLIAQRAHARRRSRPGVQAAARHARGDRSLEERLGDESAAESEHAEMLSRYSELQESFRRLEGYSIDLKITTVLRGLGFSPEDMDKPSETFSGGWQMRIALAKLLLDAPRPAAARRADQPPRSRRAQLARGVPLRLPARRHPRVARPLLPRRGRHAHHRDRAAQAHRLRRATTATTSSSATRAWSGCASRSAIRTTRSSGCRRSSTGSAIRRRRRRRCRAGSRCWTRSSPSRSRPSASASTSPSPPARRAAAWCSTCAACARRTAPAWCSTASTCTSSAAIASRSSARTAPASPR